VKRHVLIGMAALLVAGIAPNVALARGPIEASIEGPGLGSPLRIRGSGEAAMAPDQPQMQLAEAAGFFPAAFRQVPYPMLARRPAGALGPRYVIEWRVPGPNGTEFLIVQDLYPYAKGGAVTFMKPGQSLFETAGTYGGWFVASPQLKETLVAAGLPPNAPGVGGDGSPFPWTLVGTLVALGALLAGAAVAVYVIRRRPQPAV
jgi:hypothetical protein